MKILTKFLNRYWPISINIGLYFFFFFPSTWITWLVLMHACHPLSYWFSSLAFFKTISQLMCLDLTEDSWVSRHSWPLIDWLIIIKCIIPVQQLFIQLRVCLAGHCFLRVILYSEQVVHENGVRITLKNDYDLEVWQITYARVLD